MCGIAGIATPDPAEARFALERMVPTMRHRGPDDDGQEIVRVRAGGEPAFVGLGFRRLAILDLSPAGHQPMLDEATGNVIVFNGEIYNYAALRAELEREGCRFRGASDTEVLLHALGRWGEAALRRFEGMYAIAFHHARNQSLLLARDPLGIKPLYVTRTAGRLLFASEIRTLLASELVSREIALAGVTGMLAFGSVQGPQTVFAAIEEFPAGHFQWLGRPAERFWSFPDVVAEPRADPVTAVRSLVQAAVRRHLVADVPVGIFLSAGIDSSIVAACAAAAARSVKSFTVGIGPRHPDDETTVAADTAHRLGLPHEIVSISDRELPTLWLDWIESLDSPSIDGFNTYLVTKALADQGIKVGLSGLGADELFGGYPVFRNGPRLRRLMTALALLPSDTVATAAEACLGVIGRPAAGDKLGQVLRGGRDPESIALALRRVATDRQLRSLGLVGPTGSLPDTHHPHANGAPLDDFNAISRIEITGYMRATLLRDSDVNSMRHSLELRVPFLDQPLVDHVLSLPGSVKQGPDRASKQLLRSAFVDRLPVGVARRRKTGFTLPIGTWMQNEMRPFCDHAIHSLAAMPCIEGEVVRNTWTSYLARPRSMQWSRPLSLVVLGDYLRRHAGR